MVKFFFNCSLISLISFFALAEKNKNPEELYLSKSIFKNSDLVFKSNRGHDPLSNYLSMNIQFKPIQALYKTLKTHHYPNLINRGEVHITVITPIEFQNILKSHISINEIEEIALQMNIQDSQLDIIGIGSGKSIINKMTEETFFIIVESENLLNIRKAIQIKIIEKGGAPNLFDPTHFYPHITIGFTKRDLHESDGIIKNKFSSDPRFNLVITP
jgi:2'-5' RNA ligase